MELSGFLPNPMCQHKAVSSFFPQQQNKTNSLKAWPNSENQPCMNNGLGSRWLPPQIFQRMKHCFQPTPVFLFLQLPEQLDFFQISEEVLKTLRCGIRHSYSIRARSLWVGINFIEVLGLELRKVNIKYLYSLLCNQQRTFTNIVSSNHHNNTLQ